MSDISKIQLPSGETYEIKDEEARSQTVIAVYTSSTKDLQLGISSVLSIDDEEF